MKKTDEVILSPPKKTGSLAIHGKSSCDKATNAGLLRTRDDNRDRLEELINF